MWWAMLYSTADGVWSDGGRSIPPLFRKERLFSCLLVLRCISHRCGLSRRSATEAEVARQVAVGGHCPPPKLSHTLSNLLNLSCGRQVFALTTLCVFSAFARLRCTAAWQAGDMVAGGFL